MKQTVCDRCKLVATNTAIPVSICHSTNRYDLCVHCVAELRQWIADGIPQVSPKELALDLRHPCGIGQLLIAAIESCFMDDDIYRAFAMLNEFTAHGASCNECQSVLKGVS